MIRQADADSASSDGKIMIENYVTLLPISNEIFLDVGFVNIQVGYLVLVPP